MGIEGLMGHTSWLQRTEIQEPLSDSHLGQESRALHSPREGSARKPKSQNPSDKAIKDRSNKQESKKTLSPNDEHVLKGNPTSHSMNWGQMPGGNTGATYTPAEQLIHSAFTEFLLWTRIKQDRKNPDMTEALQPRI